MYKKVFLDTNVIADFYDDSRPFYDASNKTIDLLFSNDEVQLFTSCDIITTLYYLLSKKNRERALGMIEEVSEWCSVIEFSNIEILECCTLMKRDAKYKDLEDTIQYVMAKKAGCDLILSNDKNFVSEDIALMSTERFFSDMGQA
jgi:predicted nucleic acid-binding protein